MPEYKKNLFVVTSTPSPVLPQPLPPTPSILTLGDREHEAINTPSQETTTVAETETDPLLNRRSRAGEELVVHNQPTLNRPMAPSKFCLFTFNHVQNKMKLLPNLAVYQGKAKCTINRGILALFLIIMIAFFGLSGIVAINSHLSQLVYPNDVVYIDAVSGFWYNQITISYEQKVLDRVKDDEAQLKIYFTEHPQIMEDVYAESSPPKDFSYPQVVIVNGSHQNYLLKGSDIEFNFSVVNPSDYSASAKICQFSTLADYENIVDKTETNNSVIEAEKKGECYLLQKPPNKFYIHESGYYWYVVSTLLSNADSVRTSFEYRLTKLYYDTPLLGTSHDCSLSSGSKSECIVANSVFGQTSTKQVLVSLTNTDSPGPYEVTLSKKYAVGISLVSFLVAEVVTVIMLCITLCVFNRKKLALHICHCQMHCC